MAARSQPQALLTSYPPRLRTYANSLLTPVLPSAVPTNPLTRTTKRGTTIINYAEDGYDDYDDDDEDGRRRTGLRSLRRDDSTSKIDPSEKVGKETKEPVEVQGVWRDWMGKSRITRSDAQNFAQANLPLTLIPIRIDVEIPAFNPLPPIPHQAPGTDPTNPLFKAQETTFPYRLRDTFLWNLHETLITTDQFAVALVQDLDLPNRAAAVSDISKQIRTQLEENGAAPGTPSKTPAALKSGNTDVTAAATPIAPDADDFSPDDTYRCIVNLNINLGSQVYTDKFEWSLLHPPGTAEAFAKQTCADLGLYGEWVPAMTHAIYEAVLRLKKEACESGGLVAGWGLGAGASGTEFPNDAAYTAGGAGAGAGWRYDPEHLADSWEPKIEHLSKEEIEKREGDRERQIRRLRRETARFSSNTGMAGGVPLGFGFSGLIEQEEERMGRGERSKKKRRFRSLSPLARAGTPNMRGTPEVGGGGGGGYGGGGGLADNERPRTLCNNCGFLFERDRKLPRWTRNLHIALAPKPTRPAHSRRNVLIIGATGKQGRALVHALLGPQVTAAKHISPPSAPIPTAHIITGADSAAVASVSAHPDLESPVAEGQTSLQTVGAGPGFHVWALTRNPWAASARRLRETYKPSCLSLIEGDLDQPSRISEVYAEVHKQSGDQGIWGVFVVLAYPGLGKAGQREEGHGKMLADLALEFNVGAFMFSSMIHPGPKTGDFKDASHLAKQRIEQYCQSLGPSGLRWIILRPAFFMENFDEYPGGLTMTVLRQSLPPETTLTLIATKDIGQVAAHVLRDPSPFMHTILSLCAEVLNVEEIADAYLRAHNKEMPAAPPILGKAFLWALPHSMKAPMRQMVRNHEARVNGEFPTWDAEVEKARAVVKMQTFYEFQLELVWYFEGQASDTFSAAGWDFDPGFSRH
ncbi:hypothetical protein P8C59_000440 [Phyllachora maydis]|uniref:NmrA-like domain-containing protein n=1 Tax=Phyllachora maydis TaxID=1825666 RepID=A0AAD9HW47_9PEZI|nr:hypothetical protein P8C59_000440 [Phyllachora maydis]